jgi:signal transduction histidine kinase
MKIAFLLLSVAFLLLAGVAIHLFLALRRQQKMLPMEELNKAQEMMLQVEKQKSLTAIVAGVAHEINNPLSGILGYVDLLERQSVSSSLLKEKLQSIKKQTLRIKEIIKELGQLSPEIDQVKFDINIPNLLNKLVKIVQQRRPLDNTTIVTDFSDHPVIIKGNHFGLWQVFESILINAIEAIAEYQPEQGTIRITLKQLAEEGMVVVDIEDNGGGVKEVEKVFDPFYTTRNRSQNKGIGLAIAFNVVREHKGSIRITNLEHGARVMVKLPMKISTNNKNIKSGGNDNA